MMIHVFFTICGVLLSAFSLAAAEEQEALFAESAIESSQQSWLVDHTRSGMGGEFFRAFAATWREQDRGAHVISVEEEQAPFFGHQINIWLGDRLLAQSRLYPSQRATLTGIAESTAALAASRLIEWQKPHAVTP